MAYATINDPSEHFGTILYTGTGTTGHPVVGVNFQPDWVWIKNKASGKDHVIIDSSRGVTKQMHTNNTNTESTVSGLTSFNSNGFTLGSDGGANARSGAHVAWNWKANGGTRTTFSESGANPAGGHQANTTAGFSIVDYTGTGSSGGTIAHGLGAVPEFFVVKGRSIGDSWTAYHHKNTSAPETDMVKLDEDGATQDNSVFWNDTAPTSTVFTVDGNNGEPKVNQDGQTYVAYCFTGIQGYSKFGKYVGNANADGPFIYTGFKPAWMIIKRTDSANSWYLVDITRDSANIADHELEANNTGAEATGTDRLDILSNGFKIRTSGAAYNADDGTYIYIAFAESPFVTSNGGPNNAQ